MKAPSYICALSALLCLPLLSAQVEAQESMTTTQLLENARSDNAFATAMFVAGWAAGTAEQLQLRAEDQRAAGADSDSVDWLGGLATCVMNDMEVADLFTALRAALRDDTIDPNMPASTALNTVAVQICISRGHIH